MVERADPDHARKTFSAEVSSLSADVPAWLYLGLRKFSLGKLILGLLILAASVYFVLGLTLPVMKLSYFYIWSDSHSILSIIRALYADGEILLASVVAIFSVLLPAAKLVYLMAAFVLILAGAGAPARLLAPVSRLAKWSMLDVLVLALTVFYIKVGGIADASTLPGIITSRLRWS